MAKVTQRDRAQANSMARINAKARTNYISKLAKLRRETMKHVVSNMTGSANSLAINAAKLVNESYLEKFYIDLYNTVGGFWARNTYNEVMGTKEDIRDAIWSSQLNSYVNSQTGELIKSVEGTLKAWVQSTVQSFVDRAIESGEGLEKLTQEASKYLANQYTGYEVWKVRQIVSQEVLSAFSYAQELGAKSAGVPFKKIWIHSGAANPHQNHVILNGVEANSAGMFNVGGTDAPYPRAGNLPASESISCMCTVLYRPIR
mgnify:CR=1 FL=1